MIRMVYQKIDGNKANRQALLSALPAQWGKSWLLRHGAVKNEQSAVLSLSALTLLHRLHPTGTLSYTSLGKPYFAEGDACIGITHTDGLAFCALAPADLPIGLDAERIDPSRASDALAARWFSESERALLAAATDHGACFFRIWTRKEALVKHSGDGMRALSETDSVKSAASGEWKFFESTVDDVLLTLCYRSPAPYGVDLQELVSH